MQINTPKPKYNHGDFIPHYGIVQHRKYERDTWIYICHKALAGGEIMITVEYHEKPDEKTNKRLNTND